MTIKVPIDIDVDIVDNEFDFSVDSNSSDILLTTDSEGPIVTELTVDQSKTDYIIDTESNQHALPIINSMVINVSPVDVPPYEGPYIASPRAHHNVVLDTDNKYCRSDITILKVPTHSAHNDYGLTFYIAED